MQACNGVDEVCIMHMGRNGVDEVRIIHMGFYLYINSSEASTATSLHVIVYNTTPSSIIVLVVITSSFSYFK